MEHTVTRKKTLTTNIEVDFYFMINFSSFSISVSISYVELLVHRAEIHLNYIEGKNKESYGIIVQEYSQIS